jgi:hypothetical protein
MIAVRVRAVIVAAHPDLVVAKDDRTIAQKALLQPVPVGLDHLRVRTDVAKAGHQAARQAAQNHVMDGHRRKAENHVTVENQQKAVAQATAENQQKAVGPDTDADQQKAADPAATGADQLKAADPADTDVDQKVAADPGTDANQQKAVAQATAENQPKAAGPVMDASPQKAVDPGTDVDQKVAAAPVTDASLQKAADLDTDADQKVAADLDMDVSQQKAADQADPADTDVDPKVAAAPATVANLLKAVHHLMVADLQAIQAAVPALVVHRRRQDAVPPEVLLRAGPMLVAEKNALVLSLVAAVVHANHPVVATRAVDLNRAPAALARSVHPTAELAKTGSY